MPLHIQPVGLQEMVLKKVTKMIIRSCSKIHYKYGSYDSQACQRVVRRIHSILMRRVKPLLDCICDKVGHSDLRKLKDRRIFYALVVHSSSKSVNLVALINRHSCDFMCYYTYCLETITKLENLTSLTLAEKNVTEKSIITIADTSYKTLQSFTVTPTMTEFVYIFSFLSKCQELRYLKIVSAALKALHYSAIGHIRCLIASLPKLEYFDNTDMVQMLSEVIVDHDHPFLSISQLTGIEADARSMSHVVKICPKLENIDITLSSSQEAPEVLKTLTNSELPLSTLKLRGLLWHSELDDLLTLKGVSLVSFTIDNRLGPMTCKNIYVIGKYCPNLKALDLDILDSFSYSKELSVDNPTFTSSMFSKLESFYFGWYRLDSYGQSIFPLILPNASKVSELMLQCSTSLPDQDAVSALLRLNPLTELAELSFIINGPGTISQQSMVCLINSCKKLRTCYIYGHIRKETRVFLQELHGRIRDENLNLQIDVFER